MMKRVSHSLYLIALLFMLSACGGGGSVSRDEQPGGGGGGNTPPPVATDPTVTLSIGAPDGSATDELSPDSPLLVTATVLDADGAPIDGQLVTFSLSADDLADFDNDTGTGLTNSDGVATIGLLVGTASGSGLVTGSITVGDADAVEGSVGFTSSGSAIVPDATVVTLSIRQQDGEEGNTVSENTPLTVSALVLDANQAPIVDELVTFTIAPDNLAVFDNNASGTALTDAEGVATIGLLVGADAGSGQVTGTIASGESDAVGFISEGTSAQVEVPADLGFFVSEPQLASSGVDVIQMQAIVKNAQNVLLEGVTVEFSANAAASISNVQPVTDALGTATADLSTANNPENRIITATASIPGFPDLNQEININVVGTAISVIGADSVIVSDSTQLTALLSDSDNTGISGEDIDIVVTDDTGADVTVDVISELPLTTNVDGRATFDFSAVASGEYVIGAGALNAATTFIINVQQDQFGFVDAPDVNDIEQDIPLSTTEWFPINLRWLRENNPFVGGEVTLAISRGSIEDNTQTTDANGDVVFNIRSDNAGIASIVASGLDTDGVQVSARIDVAFIATEPASIIVDATPDALGPNEQTSTISAVVRDALGNRVGNQPVNFSVFDVSNGRLVTPVANTDRRGIASTIFESNVVSSNEAVVITASVESESGTIAGDATLTVGDRPFDVSLGTGRLLESPQASSYRKEFSVFVTDADGNPIPNTEVSLSANPLRVTEGDTYSLGTWLFNEDAQLYVPVNYHFDADGNIETDADDVPLVFAPHRCSNEDIDNNGILDDGEDRNGDTFLTPGIVGAITPTVTTDENGQALVFFDYPRQFGNWTTMKITARTGSEGSESRESLIYTLDVALEDLNVEGSPPPSSPYGLGNDCSVPAGLL